MWSWCLGGVAGVIIALLGSLVSHVPQPSFFLLLAVSLGPAVLAALAGMAAAFMSVRRGSGIAAPTGIVWALTVVGASVGTCAVRRSVVASTRSPTGAGASVTPDTGTLVGTALVMLTCTVAGAVIGRALARCRRGSWISSPPR